MKHQQNEAAMNWNKLVKYITGELSQAERKQVEAWVQQDPANEEYLNSIEELWEKSRSDDDIDFDIDELDAWKLVQGKMKGNGNPTDFRHTSSLASTTSQSTSGKQSGWFWFAKVAALIIVAFGISWFVTIQLMMPAADETASIEMKELSTTRGQSRVKVNFSDGTQITLNAASSLKYPERFTAGRREVFLNGEAYFNVAHLNGDKFIVHTQDASVEVLGTEFNVKAWQEDDQVEVAVEDGKVAFSTTQNGKTGKKDSSVLLTRGLGSVLEKGTLSSPKKVDLDVQLAWLKGGLVFQQTPFPDVLESLERKYDVEFHTHKLDQSTRSDLFTGEFYNRPLSEVLSVLEVSMRLTFDVAGKNISVMNTD